MAADMYLGPKSSGELGLQKYILPAIWLHAQRDVSTADYLKFVCPALKQ